ncbi:MAG TPA: SpoIIE family protein phosphatase [Candidatus Ozemobacteraceae bacterium]
MTRWQLLARWIATCLVFFALPLLLVTYGFGIRWETIEQDSIEESYRLLDEALLAFRKREATTDLLNALVFRLQEVADRAADRVSTLRRGIASLKRRFPGTLRFTVTDSRGEIIETLTDGVPPRTLVRRLYEAVSKAPPRDGGLNVQETMRKRMSGMWSMFQNFIGREAQLARMDLYRHGLVEVSYLEEGRWFGYTASERGGLFVHANHTPDWPLLALRDLMARFMKSRAGRLGIEVGLQDLNSTASASPALALALGEYQQSTREHHLIGDRLFAIMPFTATSRLWASRPRSVAVDYGTARLLLVILVTLIFAVCATLSHLVMVRGVRFPFPIRWRLVVLFGFASGIPLAVVVFAGWDYLHQKYKTRIRQTHDEAERALRAFDARFPQMRGMMEVTFARMAASCISDQGLERVRKVMSAFSNRYYTNNMVLYDSSGDVAIDMNPASSGSESLKARKMMGLVGAQVIANLNKEKYSGKLDAASLLIETISQGENLPAHLTREIGRVLNLSMAGNETWMLMLPIRSSTGRVTHVLLGYWRKFDLELVYLSKYLIPSQRALPGFRLYAWNAGGKNTPPDFPLAGKLTPLISSLKLRQATTISQVTRRDETWLATGIKPRELANHLLVGLMPKAPIIEEMRLLERRLQLFTGMILVMSVFLGINLSQRFLAPIGALATGVDAIRQRRFEHRVPDAGQDELGDLARTFNGVMEGLADLEVARIVQESLFPSNEVKAGEYAIYGESHTMTALGGDYFDLQKLADGRVLVLVGDVSGHGVPAALVMAMAKALVERESELSSAPEQILDVIHRVFYRTLKRKRMMTCFLGILDPIAHRLLYANAGHNYPVKFRRGEKPLFLELNGMPLGSMKKNTIKSAETELQPGDRVVFYTDGIVEAKIGGEEIGYQRMSEELERLLCDDARQSCERIFTWHRGLTGATDQQDDITLLVLSRASHS